MPPADQREPPTELMLMPAQAAQELGASAARTVLPMSNNLLSAARRTLADVHVAFRRWFGAEYDLDAIDAVLATAAAERLNGDPLWLLLVSGSGNAKTETVQPLEASGAIVTSTISSEGGLLSGTAKSERSTDASGGLLRRIGATGLLVIKDVTSILSMDRNTRAAVLAAFREIHDGKWERNIGSDGGRTLSWVGRIGVIGASTTAWDRAHDVIASMGDRFVVIRPDSTTGRQVAGRRAMWNTGRELTMRQELSDVVAGVLRRVERQQQVNLSEGDRDGLLAAADIVTRCRTGVDYDYRGDVVDAHAPEMPTRFAKQLVQVVRGGVALGMDCKQAMRLALRCARDSMPPLRLAILEDVAHHPESTPTDVRKRIDKPRATVDRQLQALHMLGVMRVDERPIGKGSSTKQKFSWHYTVADDVDPRAIEIPDLLPPAHKHTEGPEEVAPHISGNGAALAERARLNRIGGRGDI